MSTQSNRPGDAKDSRWLAESTPQTWGELVRAGGADHSTADCGSAESHERRLRAVLRLPLRSGDTLLELGCGTGRLADFLPAGVGYVGLDWSEAVIEEARRRRPDAEFRIGTEDDLSAQSWVVASGPFNYEYGWAKTRTAEALGKMWAASTRGIAVTVLRTPAERRLHYSASEVTEMVEGLDWSELECDRSYLPNDLCLRAWRASPARADG